MGFLNNLLAATRLPDTWHELKSLDDLKEAERMSFDKPVVLFKHSVTCGISAGAFDRLESWEASANYGFYYLDLKAHRDVSNEIAARYGIIHQSPQVIVLRNGQAVFNTSHHAIQHDAMQRAIAGAV